MTTNLYAKYLLAERIQAAAERCGTTLYNVEFRDQYGDEKSGGVDIRITLDSFTIDDAEEREDIVDQMLTALPFLKLHRDQGSMYLKGTTHQGIRVKIWAGNGVCERVQIGTRTVSATEEHEEPIFEVRCIDTLAETVNA